MIHYLKITISDHQDSGIFEDWLLLLGEEPTTWELIHRTKLTTVGNQRDMGGGHFVRNYYFRELYA